MELDSALPNFASSLKMTQKSESDADSIDQIVPDSQWITNA
jgi:hypothetical protein